MITDKTPEQIAEMNIVDIINLQPGASAFSALLPQIAMGMGFTADACILAIAITLGSSFAGQDVVIPHATQTVDERLAIICAIVKKMYASAYAEISALHGEALDKMGAPHGKPS